MTQPLGAQLTGGGIGGWFESHLRASQSACVEDPDTPELVLCGVTRWGPSELVLSLVPEADELAPKTPSQVTEALVTTCCLSVPLDNFRYTCDICGKKYKYYSCFQEHRDLHAVDGEPGPSLPGSESHRETPTQGRLSGPPCPPPAQTKVMQQPDHEGRAHPLRILARKGPRHTPYILLE